MAFASSENTDWLEQERIEMATKKPARKGSTKAKPKKAAKSASKKKGR